MKIFTAVLFVLLAMHTSSAQIAVSGRFISNNSEGFDLLADEVAFRTGFEVGIGYWFRLESKRLEFTPEISYFSLSSDISTTGFGINGNILIYPLDFHSDCNACPTFSKEGGLIKKGFYWLISPGLLQISHDNPFIQEEERSQLTYRLGVGLGLDLGVTNLITLSPFAMYNITGVDYLFNSTTPSPTSSGLSQVHLGVRATLRFDKDRW